ncbi:MAG: hypothetical protein AAFR61_32130 [Bacteroidota bacterium]
MNLIELIPNLKEPHLIREFLQEHAPGIDFYDAEIYLESSIHTASPIRVFDSQKIPGLIEMEVDQQKYVHLFSLDHGFMIFSLKKRKPINQ